MRRVVITLGLLALGSGAFAAGTSCDTVKADIDAKLQAKQVAHYSLEVVDKDSASASAKVVGSCEGGSKEIVYQRR